MTENEVLAPDAEFEKRLREGRFCLQRCDDTGRFFFYPRALSPFTGSTNIGWHEVSGEATVYSTSVVRRRPESGGDYNICIVALAEGPKMMSRVEGVAPHEVRIGMAVRARIREEDGAPLVVFEPV